MIKSYLVDPMRCKSELIRLIGSKYRKKDDVVTRKKVINGCFNGLTQSELE